jgi:prolyl 4-hydroxylase
MNDTVQSHSAKAPAADKSALKKLGAKVRKRLAANPRVQAVMEERAEIFAVGEFLSVQECDRLIAMVDGVAKPSTVFDLNYQDQYRTSYSGDVNFADPFVRSINRRIDDLLGIDPSFGENIQGQRYLPGQQFKEHCDWFYTAADYWKQEKAHGGQRSWTAMAYLNEVEEGGSTDFTRIGVSVPPQRGALLVWNNATPDGLVNYDTMHAGTPVTQGVKYVITKWYRTRRWG